MFLMIPFTAAMHTDTQRRVGNCIREAAQRSYGSISNACIDMQVRQSHFGEALDGDRGLPPGFLSLDAKFWGWLAVELVKEFGVPQEIKDGMRLWLGMLGRRRMAKAQIQREVA